MKCRILAILLAIFMIIPMFALTSCNYSSEGKDNENDNNNDVVDDNVDDNTGDNGDDNVEDDVVVPTPDEYFNFVLQEDGTYGISAKDTANIPADLVIPSEYNGVAVTSITYGAFYQCIDLMSVVIPDSITTIESSAFCDCINMRSVTIGNGVTEIGDWAFAWCETICNIELPDSLVSIGDYAFISCASLTNITFGRDLRDIGTEAFSWCYALYVIRNNSDLVISFNDDNDLSELTASAKVIYNNGEPTYAAGDVEYIIQDDFIFEKSGDSYVLIAYVGSNSNVTLPENVNGSAYEIFEFRGAHRVVVPETVTSLGESAFSQCNSLLGITFGDSLVSLGDRAFYYCPRLRNVHLPESLSSIGESVFAGHNFSSITIDENNAVFYVENNCIIKADTKALILGCSNSVIPDDVLVISTDSFASSNISGIVIPNGVETIEDMAFYGCENMESIFIPASVTSIGDRAFGLCISLEVIAVSPYNEVYSAEGNCLVHKETKTVLTGSLSSVIPEGIEVIDNEAFASFFNQDILILPDGLQDINGRAFMFSGLQNIVIPASVKSISGDVFDYCYNLTNIYFMGSEEQWNAIDFGTYEKLDTYATIHFDYVITE